MLLIENETNKKITTLRTDSGTEYVNRVFQNWLKENGIKHQTRVPHSPEQNGVAERVFRTVVEKLQDNGLDKKILGRSC
jgi:transposase InsO family protein